MQTQLGSSVYTEGYNHDRKGGYSHHIWKRATSLFNSLFHFNHASLTQISCGHLSLIINMWLSLTHNWSWLKASTTPGGFVGVTLCWVSTSIRGCASIKHRVQLLIPPSTPVMSVLFFILLFQIFASFELPSLTDWVLIKSYLKKVSFLYILTQNKNKNKKKKLRCI